MSFSGQVIVDPLSAAVTIQRPHPAAPTYLRGPKPDAMALTAPGAGLVATGISAPALLWLARKVLQEGPDAVSPKQVVADIKNRLPKDLRRTRETKTPSQSPWKIGLLTCSTTAVLAGLGAALAVSSRRQRRAERAKLAARAVALSASPRSSVCSVFSRESTITTPRGSVVAPQRVPVVHRMASKSPPRDLMDRQTSVSQWYSDDVPAAEKTNRSMGRVMSMGRDTAMRLRADVHTTTKPMGRQASLGQWYQPDATESQPMGASLSSWYQADPTQSQGVGMAPATSVGNWYQQSEPVVDITGCASTTMGFGGPARRTTVVAPPTDWLSEDDEDDIDVSPARLGVPSIGISFDEEEEDRAVEAALREETTNSTGISDNDADVDSAPDAPFPVGKLTVKPRRQTTDTTASASEDAASSEASYGTSAYCESPPLPYPLNLREPAQKFKISDISGRHSSAARVSAHEIQTGHIASTRALFEKHNGTVSMPLRGHRGDLL